VTRIEVATAQTMASIKRDDLTSVNPSTHMVNLQAGEGNGSIG